MMKKLLNPIRLFPKQDLKGRYCLSPFVQINISDNGSVGMCGCRDWQPTTIGNIFDHTLQELLSNPVAQQIRNSIIEGTYEYCNSAKCGILREGVLNTYESLPESVKWAMEDSERFSMPHHIVLALDATCNLYCPSCRHSILKYNDDQKEKQKELSLKLTKNLFGVPSNNKIELTMDTSGEVFSSNLLLDFVGGISRKDFPNLELDFLSNGLLAPKRWYRLGDMQNHVKKITVSYDSPDPGTYERLRRGGKWNDLVDALKFLRDKKSEIGMKFNVRMVVQKDNYMQMKQFYDFSKSLGADDIQFQRIQNWAYTPAEFMEIGVDVFNPAHKQYDDAVKNMQQVEHLPDTFFWHGFPKIH